MKHSTAMSRLTDVCDELDRAGEWPDSSVTGAFVFGAVLEADTDLDRVEVALVVAEPPEVVPWMSRPAHLEALAAMLRFTKLPLSCVRVPRSGRSGTMRSIARSGSGARPTVGTSVPSTRSRPASSTT
ncbi:MAG: hypothetical protein QOI08_4181 [Actinomycetota bacterium]|nr:hypothetical protein [Actinomycetota bacterium]